MTTYIRSYEGHPSFEVEGSADGKLSAYRFSIKDIFCVRGYPCSWGIQPYYIEQANETASIVIRLCSAGAHLIGATNLSPLSLDIIPRNPFFGDAVDPNVLGSSFGAALSIADSPSDTEAVDFAFGSDSGGSIRAPAASINAIGFKGSSSSFPRDDVLLLESAIDSIGFMCRSFSTMYDVLDVFSGDEIIPSKDIDEAVTGFFVPHPNDLRKYSASFIHEFTALYSTIEKIAPIRTLDENFFERINKYRSHVLSRLYRTMLDKVEVRKASEQVPQLRALVAYADALEGKELSNISPEKMVPRGFNSSSVLVHPTLAEISDLPNVFLSAANVLDLKSISVPLGTKYSICFSSQVSSYLLGITAEKIAAQ